MLHNNNKVPLNVALRAGTEVVSGLFVGVIFGLGIDHLFNTKPFGLLIMIMLGAAAGIRNIFKLVNRGFFKVQSNNLVNPNRDSEKKS
jgi:F0F1-type ATP synthase assembly protein I